MLTYRPYVHASSSDRYKYSQFYARKCGLSEPNVAYLDMIFPEVMDISKILY